MDLKDNKITVGELLDDPRSRAVLYRKIPMLAGRQLTGASRTVTLEQLLSFTEAFLPKWRIVEVLEALRRA